MNSQIHVIHTIIIRYMFAFQLSCQLQNKTCLTKRYKEIMASLYCYISQHRRWPNCADACSPLLLPLLTPPCTSLMTAGAAYRCLVMLMLALPAKKKKERKTLRICVCDFVHWPVCQRTSSSSLRQSFHAVQV